MILDDTWMKSFILTATLILRGILKHNEEIKTMIP